LVLALAVIVLSSFVAQAHPYASGITNTSGTISFILNEAADGVGVYFPDNHSTNSLTGPFPASRNYTFTLGPGTNAYVIYVTKAGTGVPNQISPVLTAGTYSTNVAFYGPRGVAVNLNPKTHNFGRVYVANASPGTVIGKHAGKGLYVLNANFTDCMGYGTNQYPLTANFPSSGAQTWGSSTTYGVFRLWVGPDDVVYAGDSSGSPNATTLGSPVWMIDPDLVYPTNMFTYIGNAGPASYSGGMHSRPFITGSASDGSLVLTCMEWGILPVGGTYQSLLQYSIANNGALPWGSGVVPTILVTNTQANGVYGVNGANGVTCDVVGNPTNNYVYMAYNRSNPGGYPLGNMQLAVYTNTAAFPGGTNHLWGSTDYSGGTVDAFQNVGIYPFGLAISPDGQYLGMGQFSTYNTCAIVHLTNGIPDISAITTFPSSAVGQRGAAFDAADNFYTVDGNSDSLTCYSLGWTTTCVTSNDASAANGSFWMVLPSTTVSVTTTTNASENNGSPLKGCFKITRVGGVQNGSQYVTWSLGGTATNGYTVLNGGTYGTNVTIGLGQASTNIYIVPTDNVARLAHPTVTLTLSSGTNYSALAPIQATMLITNTGEPQLILSAAASTAYKRFTNDYASVTITRWGNTNASLPVSTLTYGGSTAVLNTDYALNSAPTIAAGATTTTFKVFRPLNPPEPVWVGNKTVVVNLGANGGTYTNMPGQASQTLTILDDKYPAAPVLWYDPLTNNVDGSTNDTYTTWNQTQVGRDNGATPPDVTVQWGYDLVNDPSGYGVIPLPPSGFGNALRATFNKVHGGVSGAVNLYPTNTFSGDYAVRFQMYIAQGGSIGVSTEGPMFGINHTGTNINWWAGSAFTGGPWASDGVWYWLDADVGGALLGDYVEFTGFTNSLDPTLNTGWKELGTLYGATSFANVFKDPETFTTVGATTNAVSGNPANASVSFAATVPSVLTANANWADVEIKQVKNLVTLSIDKTVIFTYANTNTLFQQGSIMLGYEDPFDSTGALDAAAFFSNVQVVRLSTLNITGLSVSGGYVTIQFTSPDGNVALQSCGVVNGIYTDVSPAATFTQDPVTDVFQTVYPQSGAAQYYRIRHLP
jgi:hypothetical protein